MISKLSAVFPCMCAFFPPQVTLVDNLQPMWRWEMNKNIGEKECKHSCIDLNGSTNQNKPATLFIEHNAIKLGLLLRIIFRNAKLATCPTLSTCESYKHIGLLLSVFTEAYALLGVASPRRCVKPIWAHARSIMASWNKTHWASDRSNLSLTCIAFLFCFLLLFGNIQKWRVLYRYRYLSTTVCL